VSAGDLDLDRVRVGGGDRFLVEPAWHYRARYRIGKTMLDRWALADPAARARGDAGNRRLHRQWERFIARNKRGTIATIAIARELVVGRPQPVLR